jgi:hypothetical protein
MLSGNNIRRLAAVSYVAEEMRVPHLLRISCPAFPDLSRTPLLSPPCSWREFPPGLKPAGVARVMYELRLVPFSPLDTQVELFARRSTSFGVVGLVLTDNS